MLNNNIILLNNNIILLNINIILIFISNLKSIRSFGVFFYYIFFNYRKDKINTRSYSICESSFFIHHGIYHDLFVCP